LEQFEFGFGGAGNGGAVFHDGRRYTKSFVIVNENLRR
jgi:hypothetical protein